MRSLMLTLLVSCASVAAASSVYAQDTPAAAPPGAAQDKPATQAPAPTPAPGNPPAPAAPAAVPPDTLPSLFEILPNQFLLGGRLTSQQGDPARFQRYQELGDGVLFTRARIAREHASGEWLFNGGAENVGWHDQRYFGSYQRPGHYTVTGFWDQIPQFYSVDTRTPYIAAENVLTLDDATQRAIQAGQATLSAYVPIAPQFDLREQRDIGIFRITLTPTPLLDVTGSFTNQRHIGELPWGASFGFGNDV